MQRNELPFGVDEHSFEFGDSDFSSGVVHAHHGDGLEVRWPWWISPKSPWVVEIGCDSGRGVHVLQEYFRHPLDFYS